MQDYGARDPVSNLIYISSSIIYDKYIKQLNKLKKQVGMVGPKSKQTRIAS